MGPVLRWGGKYYMGFVENLILFQTVQKLWKSVNIWLAYTISQVLTELGLWSSPAKNLWRAQTNYRETKSSDLWITVIKKCETIQMISSDKINYIISLFKQETNL